MKELIIICATIIMVVVWIVSAIIILETTEDLIGIYSIFGVIILTGLYGLLITHL